MPEDKISLLPVFLARRLQEGGGGGGIYNGQILIFVKVIIRVRTLGDSTSLLTGLDHLRA